MWMVLVSLTEVQDNIIIWTFASKFGSHHNDNCRCTNSNQVNGDRNPPAFVRNDYFCDTGISGRYQNSRFYGGDPLWDGAGCGPLNTCCSFKNPPWFYK